MYITILLLAQYYDSESDCTYGNTMTFFDELRASFNKSLAS